MSWDCEIPRWYVWKEVIARKPHDCVECNAPILIGEKYLRVNICYENTPCTEKQHLLCAEACELVRDKGLNDDECVFYGGLKEWWREADRFPNAHDLPARRKFWRLMLRIMRRERRSSEIPARLEGTEKDEGGA